LDWPRRTPPRQACPEPVPLRPKSLHCFRIRPTTSPTAEVVSRKFRKPGPATSTEAIPAVPSGIRSWISWAMARGARRRVAASVMATLVATSPWEGSRGRSRWTWGSSTPISRRTSWRTDRIRSWVMETQPFPESDDGEVDGPDGEDGDGDAPPPPEGAAPPSGDDPEPPFFSASALAAFL